MNRIDEFTNALEGWLVEWAEKRQQVLPHREVLGDECAIEDCPYESDGTSAYCLDHKREQPTADDGYVSDWRDEAGITDAAAESERYK